jgi:hypothetical protein
MTTKPQLAIAVMAAAALVTGFFLIYPGGLFFYNFNGRPVEVLPEATIEGLKDRYRAGEELAFSVRVEGYWNDDGSFPETVVKKVADADGRAADEMVWIDRGVEGSPESYDQNPDRISKVRHIAGNALYPLVLREPGTYSVIVQGDNVEGAEERFRVS